MGQAVPITILPCKKRVLQSRCRTLQLTASTLNSLSDVACSLGTIILQNMGLQVD